MKPILLEMLARLLESNEETERSAGPAPERDKPLTELNSLVGPNGAPEEPRPMLLPLEAVASLSERRTGGHIVDITDQYIGKSLILTGAKKPRT